MVAGVVITGLGVVSAAGSGVEALVDKLAAGKPLVRHLNADPDGTMIGVPARDFAPVDVLGRNVARRLGRAAQLATVAAEMALQDAGNPVADCEPARCAISEATSTGNLGETLAYQRQRLSNQRGPGARIVATAMNGSAGGHLCAQHGIRGPAMALSNGSCSSASALGVARDLLQTGAIDVVVVTAGEAPLVPELVSLFADARLGSRNTASPAEACRPFDRDRDGTVLAEAGAAAVLERAETARDRGAPSRARLLGFQQTSDGVAGVRPSDSVAERARAICDAVADAGLAPSDIDWLCAHGPGTRINDPHEAHAIREALGAAADVVPVTALKATLGHALGACSVLELVAAIGCMEQEFLPCTPNLEHVGEGCELRHVVGGPLTRRARFTALNSASFGGRNATIVVGSP